MSEVIVTFMKRATNQYGNLPDKKERYLELSKSIQNWMTVDELSAKLNICKQHIYKKMKLCYMYGFVVKRYIHYKTKKFYNVRMPSTIEVFISKDHYKGDVW